MDGSSSKRTLVIPSLRGDPAFAFTFISTTNGWRTERVARWREVRVKRSRYHDLHLLFLFHLISVVSRDVIVGSGRRRITGVCWLVEHGVKGEEMEVQKKEKRR